MAGPLTLVHRRARTTVLVALGLLGESYPRELARLLEISLSGVQRALRSLNRSEEDQATEPALRDPANSAGRQ